MLAVGDTVIAEVTSPQVFGVFCQHDSRDMLVLIPETSWIASFNSCVQFAQAGDQLKVAILNIDESTSKIAASVKALHPDPWQGGRVAVGTQYNARVARFVESADRCGGEPAYLVELLPGAYAMLAAKNHKALPNQNVVVKLLAADFRQRSALVDWA